MNMTKNKGSLRLWFKAADQVFKDGLLRRLPVRDAQPSPWTSTAALRSHWRNAFPREFWLRFGFLLLYGLIGFLLFHILDHFLRSFWFFRSFCGFRNVSSFFGRPLTLGWGSWRSSQLCFDELQVIHYLLFCLHK